MRILPVLTAIAFGLVASSGAANAQATNTSPESGRAPSLSQSSPDAPPKAVPAKRTKKAVKRTRAKK